MQSILVLCIGNICRSPMAEALLKQAMPDRRICSAGLGALVGKPADPHSVQLMAERGIDISGHRAQQVNMRLVQDAELILVMDQDQKKEVEARYPAARGKVFRIGHYGKFDVADPYREEVEHFRSACRLIETGVQDFVKLLAQMA